MTDKQEGTMAKNERGMPKAEAMARLFHDTYERLAPQFGYETRKETREFDPATPNGQLMIAVCAEVTATLQSRLAEAECHHGWRGTVPEDGKRITTPCPACGGQLFIGSGGHLTCSYLGSDHGPYNGCPEPSVERYVKDLKSRLAECERDAGDARRRLRALLEGLECKDVDAAMEESVAILTYLGKRLARLAKAGGELDAALAAKEHEK